MAVEYEAAVAMLCAVWWRFHFLSNKREEIRVSEFHFFTHCKMLLRDLVYIKSNCTLSTPEWHIGGSKGYTLRPFVLAPERT